MTARMGKGPILGIILLAGTLTGSLAAQQKPAEIPDAPSATRPIPPPPPPSPRQAAEQDSAADAAAAKEAEEVTHGAKELPRTDPGEQAAPPPAMPPVKTVPAGSVPKDFDTGQDLYTIRTATNLVLVPVMVKDGKGRLIGGLQPRDFSVLENGQRQTLKFFTSDPFSLAAAVIVDTGMPDIGVEKVRQTLSALQGAFSQYDEVALYTYSSTAGQLADFNAVGKQLTAALNTLKGYTGANNGPPVTSGPLGPQGPTINGLPMDVPVTPVSTPPRVARVMNDAILLAARDLSKRDRARRKIIFIISDGREMDSQASYADTLKVLLTQNIIVYAVGLEGAAMPMRGKLEQIHLPRLKIPGVADINAGYSNILPKYVSATGGGTVYAGADTAGIEKAYAQAIGDARNQYTLAYSSKPGIGRYREIEVRVRRPDVKVYSKAGYYPLPAPH